jgi:quercetin dioxygenase-like cupin family protein
VNSRFVRNADVPVENFDWGRVGWRLTPAAGAFYLVVMDIRLDPGQGHSFHYHPGQEEIIIIKNGWVTQYIEERPMRLGPLDAVFIETDVVHASFNDGDETVDAHVIIAPSSGSGAGYAVEDVSDLEPWCSLRTTGRSETST